MCLKQWDLEYQELFDLSQLPTFELYLKLCILYKINYTWLLLLSLVPQ